MNTDYQEGSSAQIKLVGVLMVPDEDMALVDQVLPAHIRLTRDEPGCLNFEVWQDPNSLNEYQVREHFVDRMAFLLHQKRTQASTWGRVTAHLQRRYTISSNAGQSA